MNELNWRKERREWAENHALDIVKALYNMSGRYYVELHGEFSGCIRDAENHDDFVDEFEDAEDLHRLARKYSR